jgi:hypothetical protein
MDPTNKIGRRTTSLIKKSNIPEEVVKKLIHHMSAPPRLYGLPKIHKNDLSLRPAVNCIAYPTCALAKYLAGLLSPLVGQLNSHIKNSEVFVQELKSIILQETDILVSFDVVSLFTKVPLEDTMQLLSQHLDEQMVVLVRHVLTTTNFLYNDSFYNQNDRLINCSLKLYLYTIIYSKFIPVQFPLASNQRNVMALIQKSKLGMYHCSSYIICNLTNLTLMGKVLFSSKFPLAKWVNALFEGCSTHTEYFAYITLFSNEL